MFKRMTKRLTPFARCSIALIGPLLCAATPHPAHAATTAAADAAFSNYAAAVEKRLEQEHRSRSSFLATAEPEGAADRDRLQRGELIIEKLAPPGLQIPGALLHDWRGTAFVRGARAKDFERLLSDIQRYPRSFAPQVVAARVLAQDGDHARAVLRLRQQHVITVSLDTTDDIIFGRLDEQHGYSISRSTHVAEIADAGKPSEYALSAADEHGFLWRLNSYWSFEECDGGLYLQIEAISLTRSIPHGLGWAIGPYLESIPRDSLSFTLRSAERDLQP
jgi:hypothetical protein